MSNASLLGGGGSLPTFTEKAVLFADTDGSITEDPTNFYYDQTTQTLYSDGTIATKKLLVENPLLPGSVQVVPIGIEDPDLGGIIGTVSIPSEDPMEPPSSVSMFLFGYDNDGNLNFHTGLEQDINGVLSCPLLSASLPVKLNGSKQITAAAINLAGSEVTGTLPAAKLPADVQFDNIILTEVFTFNPDPGNVGDRGYIKMVGVNEFGLYDSDDQKIAVGDPSQGKFTYAAEKLIYDLNDFAWHIPDDTALRFTLDNSGSALPYINGDAGGNFYINSSSVDITGSTLVRGGLQVQGALEISGSMSMLIFSPSVFTISDDAGPTEYFNVGTDPGFPDRLGVFGRYFRLAESADADAPNNSHYYSTDANKAVYKDPGGTVNALY